MPPLAGGVVVNIRMTKAAVDRSAQSVEKAAENVAAIDFGSELAKLAAALPESRSAGSTKSLKSEWKREQDAWVKQAHAHHRTTLADARVIEAADEHAGAQGNAFVSQVSDWSGLHTRLGGS